MTSIERDPLCKFEHEPEDNGGLLETLILMAAILLTYLTGYANGVKELTAFCLLGILALAAWAWLLKVAAPKDDDKGL